MSRLVTALLVRNEADKHLARVLRHCARFSDRVLVLDDGSTDDSREVARACGAEVRERGGDPMWGQEAHARAQLYAWGAEAAGDGWLLICDADMLLSADPRPLTHATESNAWAWPLYDLWDSEATYRCDGFWQGHRHPRVWMVRPRGITLGNPEWPTRGVHCGHLPVNAQLRAAVAPAAYYWLHLAYVDRGARLTKYGAYANLGAQLTPWERAHAQSVLD